MLRYSFLMCIVFGLLLQAKKRMSNEEKQEMLRLHNKVRQDAMDCKIPGQPGAEKMPLLQWDDELAKTAQVWANECTPGYDNQVDRKTAKFPKVGQNWGAGHRLQQGFDGWYKPYKNYNFNRRSCTTNQCYKYTQLVDARTTHIGCAKAICPQHCFYSAWVCNYGPTGNVEVMSGCGLMTKLAPYRMKAC